MPRLVSPKVGDYGLPLRRYGSSVGGYNLVIRREPRLARYPEAGFSPSPRSPGNARQLDADTPSSATAPSNEGRRFVSSGRPGHGLTRHTGQMAKHECLRSGARGRGGHLHVNKINFGDSIR